MDENIAEVLEMTQMEMKGAIEFLEKQLLKIRAGKANPSMLSDVSVNYYGAPTPLTQVANVSVGDSRTLFVKPWEKNMIPEVAKAITNSGLGLNAQSDSDKVIVPIPSLTGERRKQLVKQAKDEAETAKISLRSMRNSANKDLKELKEDGVSEDDVKKGEDQVNALTQKFGNKVDELLKAKEEEITTV